MTESAAPVRGTPAKAFEPNQIMVGTSVTLLVPAREGRRAVVLINHGTTDVFLGGDGVTTTTGLLLAGARGAGIVVPTDVAVYGIVATGTQRISYAELYGR